MITMTTASRALKTKYGPLLTNQLNVNTSPFYKEVEKTSKYLVGGNQFVMAAPIGINGGIGAINETDPLPTAGYQEHANLTTVPKTLTGVFRITDKAWKSAQKSEDAFINLFTSEAQSLEKGTKWDLNRQMWGDGTGIMGELAPLAQPGNTFTITTGIQNFIEGQVVDIYDYSGASGALNKVVDRGRIIAVNNKPGGAMTITLTTITGGPISVALTAGANSEPPYVTMQGSLNNEITGLATLHDNNIPNLYGLPKNTNPWLVPHTSDAQGALSDSVIQNMLNYLEDYFGANINMIQAGANAYTAYFAYLEATKRNINIQRLAGGFTALSYGEIPIIRDRFAPATTMQFLETAKWHFHQLGDWEWMDGYAGDGNILQQVPGYAYYQATLIKHADLMCEHPGGQGRLINCA
jgi:hypothetical protein